jgi:hypothetical protein
MIYYCCVFSCICN